MLTAVAASVMHTLRAISMRPTFCAPGPDQP
jgi:hypothetical protein